MSVVGRAVEQKASEVTPDTVPNPARLALGNDAQLTAGVAAGESRRMGFPKALLPYRGETFLDTLIGLLGERCSPVIVVLGAAAERMSFGVGTA